jgi:hypothetical protein
VRPFFLHLSRSQITQQVVDARAFIGRLSAGADDLIRRFAARYIQEPEDEIRAGPVPGIPETARRDWCRPRLEVVGVIIPDSVLEEYDFQSFMPERCPTPWVTSKTCDRRVRGSHDIQAPLYLGAQNVYSRRGTVRVMLFRELRQDSTASKAQIRPQS